MVSNKAIRQALYTKLNVAAVTNLLGGGSASLVHGVAKPDTEYPICVFNKQAGTPTDRFGGLAYDTQVWLVKGVVRSTSSSVAEDIHAAVNTLLDFGTLSITGGSLMHMARMSDVDYIETEADQTFRHHGAMYRLWVQD